VTTSVAALPSASTSDTTTSQTPRAVKGIFNVNDADDDALRHEQGDGKTRVEIREPPGNL